MDGLYGNNEIIRKGIVTWEIPTPEEWLYYAVNYLIEHGDGDLLRWYPIL